MWSPTSSIIIHGERDAIPVNIPVTNAQATALADWVEETGKILTPSTRRMVMEVSRAKAVATPKMIEIVRKQMSPQVMAGLWNKRFLGLIPENIVLPEQLELFPPEVVTRYRNGVVVPP